MSATPAAPAPADGVPSPKTGGLEARPTRRVFLSSAGLGVASVVAAALGARSRSLGPLLPAVAEPATSPMTPSALPAALTAMAEGEWHVDDMWGPRYAAPIPYMHVAAPPDFSAYVAPVDRNLVV